MIFKTSITEYTGTVFKNLGYHVLNTDRVGRPRAVNGSGSQFFYTDRTADRRRKPMPAYCNSTLSTISAAIDSVLTSHVMTLNIFTDNDINKAVVEKHINYSQLIYATPHRLNSAYSLVTFIEGFKISKVLVNNSLDELVEIAATGTTSTTSTSTTSTTSTTTTLIEVDTVEWDDGVSYFRLQVRLGALYLDQTKTPTGFAGSEPTDWDDILNKLLP